MESSERTPALLVVGGQDRDRRAIESQCVGVNTGDTAIRFVDDLSSSFWQVLSGQFDTVLLDERLARAQLPAVLARVNDCAPSLPVIIFTDDKAKVKELKELGLAEVLTDSELNSDQLRAAVQRAIFRWRGRSQLNEQISDFLITHGFEGVAAFDSNRNVVLWNPKMERMFGIGHGKALGRPIEEILPFLADVGETRLLDQALSGMPVVGRERCFYDPEREMTSYFRTFYSPLAADVAGKPIGAAAIFRDITERRHAETALSQCEERLCRIADASPNLLWICNEKGERTFFNKRWLNLTGRTLAQELGYGWMESVFRPHLKRVSDCLQKAISSRENFHVQYRLRSKDSRYRWMLESGTAQYTRDGAFIGFIGSCTDISETRMTQSRIAIAAGEELTASVETHDNSPMGVWKLDRRLSVLKANPAVGAQLATAPGDLIGRYFFEIVPSADSWSLEKVLSEGEHVHLENRRIAFGPEHDDRVVFWDVDAWPMTDVTGQIVGVGLNTMEVTERQKVQQMREDLVATLVHDLKTPLTGADRTLEQMIKGGLGQIDENHTRVLTMLQRSNKQLLSMVQNLIEVYRYEADKPRLLLEDVSLFELLGNGLTELAALAEHKGVRLRTDLKTSDGCVRADRLAIRRVFFNLLDNAIKFTPRDGEVSVSGEEQANAVIVNVTDSGIGIAGNERPFIFQRFSQGQRGKKYAPGTGLGLYLCKQIVEAHGGEISFISIEGAGTTFTVRLPKVPDLGAQTM